MRDAWQLRRELLRSEHVRRFACPGFEVTGAFAHPQMLRAEHYLPLQGGRENSHGVVDGAEQVFKTQALGSSLTLPDGRAWELVSPADKDGAVVKPIGEAGVVQAAADGDGMTYLTSRPTEADPDGYNQEVQVLSTRGADGWSSVDIAPSNSAPVGLEVGVGYEYRFFSENLELGITESLGPFSAPEGGHENAQHEDELVAEASPEPTERTPYLRHDATCAAAPRTCYEPLVTAAAEGGDVPEGVEFGGDPKTADKGDVAFVDATPDGRHVLLSSSVGLTAGTSGGLYEWTAGRAGAERLQFVRRAESDIEGWTHAISDDGSVFFNENGHLYLHDPDSDETVYVHVAPGTASEGEPEFLYASSDGKTLLFKDPEPLTGGSGGGVYECRLAEGAGGLECSGLTLTGLSFAGTLIGGSEAADYLYFDNGDSLYVDRDEAGTWRETPIATISGEDAAHDGTTDLASRTARVSPDGEWFAFMSQYSLTGYDNRDAVSGKPEEEVYLYDALTQRVVCASCDPTGARPDGVEAGKLAMAGGDRVWQESTWIAASIPGWTAYNGNEEVLYQSRYLSDGGRLFFNSSDALVPQDVNDNEDVYEYEPVRVGSCTNASTTFNERSGGCVGLISSGVAYGESAFLDASKTGGDVFFLTSEKLTPQAKETASNVYDAHECTGASPCSPVEPAQPGECTSAASCRAAPSPQPQLYGAPPSATFSGAGDIVPVAPVVAKAKPRPKSKPAKCKKGAARRRGGCAKSRAAKKPKAKEAGHDRRTK